MDYKIPFNKPFIVGKELFYIAQAVMGGHLASGGPFSKRCERWLEKRLGTHRAFLTHSCTAALEMAAILTEVGPGDEVLMPSFTYVSTANAFVLRGAMVRFVDIRSDTLNIDENLLDSAASRSTKVIVPVHYAGVAAEMEAIMDTAGRVGAYVVEDAAQALGSSYNSKPLGSLGHLAAISFHETKNFISGEGGALLVNEPAFLERAAIIREKGTDRERFLKGEVDKYTWVDIGSSYGPSEVVAAFLYAQLEEADKITEKRLAIHKRYGEMLAPLEEKELLSLPHPPSHSRHNGHLFYVLTRNQDERDRLMGHMKSRGILAVFHYVPLHLSPMGRRMGYSPGDLPVTEDLASKLLRLPCYFELSEQEQEEVASAIYDFFGTPMP